MINITRSEENRLVKLAQSGNRKAMGFLVKNNMGLIYQTAVHYKCGRASVDDIYACAVIGWMEGVMKFDPSHGVRLGSYAIQWCRRRAQLEAIGQTVKPSEFSHRMLGALEAKLKRATDLESRQQIKRKIEHHRKNMPAYVYIDKRMGESDSPHDLPSCCREYERDPVTIMRRCGLTDKQIDIIKRRMRGETYQVIAARYGYDSVEAVRRIVKKDIRAKVGGRDFMERPRMAGAAA